MCFSHSYINIIIRVNNRFHYHNGWLVFGLLLVGWLVDCFIWWLLASWLGVCCVGLVDWWMMSVSWVLVWLADGWLTDVQDSNVWQRCLGWQQCHPIQKTAMFSKTAMSGKTAMSWKTAMSRKQTMFWNTTMSSKSQCPMPNCASLKPRLVVLPT